MDNKLHTPSGQGLVPSLFASPSGRAPSDVNELDDGPGILDVVDHRQRAQSKPRSLTRLWMMLAGAFAVGIVGWGWWLGSSRPARPSSLPTPPVAVDVSNVSQQQARIAAPWPDSKSVAAPDAARIESVELQVSNDRAVEDAVPEAVRPLSEVPPQASLSRSSEPRRPSAVPVVRETNPASKRIAGRRATDPDAEVIEVLMTRAAPAGLGSYRSSTAGAGAPPASQDVVLIQPTLPTEELLRRCNSLGGLEAQLCQARICQARGDQHAGCAVDGLNSGRP